MLLTENFKKRLLELAGVYTGENIISEADKRNVIVSRLNLSKEIADWAHNLSDKYSIWIAESFKKLLLNLEYIDKKGNITGSLPDIYGNIDARKKDEFNTAIINLAKQVKNDYEYILDWLKGRTTLAPETDQLNFKTLTFEEAKERSEEWHKKLKDIQGGKIEGEEGEIVMTFPEGFYWIRLGKNYCSKEAEAMGHCGRATPGDILYSLRKNQFPYITAAIHEDTGIISQMKGRANTKPKAQFHKYILPFLFDKKMNIRSFKSTYSPQTDFNINDLTDAELKQVLNKKPTLFELNGSIALKRLSDEEIMFLLLKHSDVIDVAHNPNIILSDVLRNKNMVDWAIQHNPYLFDAENWGTVEFDKEQLVNALNSKHIVNNLYVDHLKLDASSINYIVTHKPELLSKSEFVILQINDGQKDYLIKNYPAAFEGFLDLITRTNNATGLELFEFLGKKRMQVLFSKVPQLFDTVTIPWVYREFLTPELIYKYIRSHNKQDDPFNILKSTNRLRHLSVFINNETAMYLLVHYPTEFFNSDLVDKTNKEGGEVLGRYIVDHHTKWLETYLTADKRLAIQDWNLTPNQKQKIVYLEAKGNTSILEHYTSEELIKLNLSIPQKKELIDSPKFAMNLNLISGLELSPEDAKEPLVDILENEPEELKKTTEVIKKTYGEEYLKTLYKEYPEYFNSLSLVIEMNDVERLKKYNNINVTYENDGVKIRYDDWQDEDILNLFSDKNVVKQIANYELDLSGYDYKFNDISGKVDDLDEVNTAKLRFLIMKSFPVEFKKTIMSMTHSQLVDVLKNPDEISEEYNESTIDTIKDVFVRVIEDCQKNADEGEYWKLFTEPVVDLLGNSKWEKVKVQKKGNDKIEEKDFLEFKISYEELIKFIKDAEEYDFGNDNDFYDMAGHAKSLKSIIELALQGRGEELYINEPHYGVSGNFTKNDLNEQFSERVNEDDDLRNLLDKAKVVVKRKSKKEK